MNKDVLTVGHAYSKSGTYKAIEPGEKEDYIEYIKTFPLNPDPEALVSMTMQKSPPIKTRPVFYF